MTDTDFPPRPRWNHKSVKEATAALFVDAVRHWAENFGVVGDDCDDREFLALLCITLTESPDAYQAGRYLEDFFGWPVQVDLLRILDAAYTKMKYVTRDKVHEWVMENNVRFPAEQGDLIRCKIGDFETSGRVVGVISREARGIFVPTNSEKNMVVLAEEIQQVLPEVNQAPKRPKPPEIA